VPNDTARITLTKQEHVDRLGRTLMLFVGILVGWLLSNLLATVFDPVGIFSLLSAVPFVGVAISFVAVLVLAGLFYSKIR
jgi:predicted metal-binding membrane protein